jgi:hypothetical protein
VSALSGAINTAVVNGAIDITGTNVSLSFFALSNSTQVLLESQRSVLPGTPITAPAGASNCRF